jgi:hypothetical protein
MNECDESEYCTRLTFDEGTVDANGRKHKETASYITCCMSNEMMGDDDDELATFD